MKEGNKMPKTKEIPIEWGRNSAGLVEGRIFFANKERNKTSILTMAGGPDEKVLKAKARIKASAPDYITDFLARYPDYEQVDRATYEYAYSRRYKKDEK